jgi:YHS domain-containing protein
MPGKTVERIVMDPLLQFSERVAARLAEARHAPVCEAAQYMAQFEPKYRQFEQLADRLLSEVVQPRLESVASFFPGARVRPAAPEHRCVAWFGFCERFPATARVEFTIDCDPQLEHAVVRFELSIVPSFMKYDAHDKLPLQLESVDEQRATAWVEERLIAFLDAYSRLDRGEDDSSNVMATDPVCGMQVDVSQALHADHRGHAYYFCSEECRKRFNEAPKKYVQFEVE